MISFHQTKVTISIQLIYHVSEVQQGTKDSPIQLGPKSE